MSDLKFTTAEINSKEFQDNPVEWFRKKGCKEERGDIRKLKKHPKNARLVKGQSYRGITVTSGTMDSGDLQQRIAAAKRILVPLVVSVQANGDEFTLCGNNRLDAAINLLANNLTDAETIKNLTTDTPMVKLTGLTEAQELTIMQDQDQKPFSAVDMVNWLFNAFDAGADVFKLGRDHWRKLVPLFGSVSKKLEIEQAAAGDRDGIIKKWVNGSLYCKLYYFWQLGPIVQKAVIGAYMMQDGVKFDDADKPYFMCLKHVHNGKKVNADGQKQAARLRTAREEDEAAGKWNPLVLMEGTKFKEVMDELHKESYPDESTATGTEGEKEVNKMRDFKTVKDRQTACLSAVARDAIGFTMSKEVPLLKQRDEFAAQQENKRMLLDQHRSRIVGVIDFAEVVTMLGYETDLTKFSAWLLSKLAPVHNPAPTTPPDNTGVNAEGVSNAG